jgi:hypothetical protein
MLKDKGLVFFQNWGMGFLHYGYKTELFKNLKKKKRKEDRID